MTTRKNLLLAALVLTGCGRMDAETQFRSALPTQEMVEVGEPQRKGQALVSDEGVQPLEKDKTSELYQLTRGTTAFINGSTLSTLALLNRVTKHTPTTLTDDTAVWGPYTEALARNAWRLTVKKTGENTYSFALAGKNKQAADAAFTDVLTGTHTPVLDEAGEVMQGFGRGEMVIDSDRLKNLQEIDSGEGALNVQYARPDSTSPVTVDARFRLGNGDKSREADYHFSAVRGQGGEFDFKMQQDLYKPAGASSLMENITIKSRWTETGAGRSDVKLSGGDLAGEATLNECWNSDFASVYLSASYDPRVGYGTEATDCVFTPAVYSSL
ncbi:hypothetical protein [Melittangium boletus]|uniref:Lipoprotein n=1 Tax=Melittangium boletus DSM 14713 TaxID=1294270 RepID=A0A250IMJ4_9BACT|nr:hypothetical protein [Melittangium boletus]ATB32411.1 hypothetical protein MEBOL_005889 [Melittangium boletus DSM 14713]